MAKLITRKAAVAGQFYPGSADELNKLIRRCFTNPEFGPGGIPDIKGKTISYTERNCIGGVVPHAGYVYSGSAAAHTYAALFGEGMPDTVVVLGTQHTGYYKAATMTEAEWETPLGRIGVNSELAELIMMTEPMISKDIRAFTGYPHGREHNIEVQLPFIQFCAAIADKPVDFVPIKIGVMDFNKLKKIGEGIGKAIGKYTEESGKDVVIVASSDMTHSEIPEFYNPGPTIEKMRAADNAVMEAVKNYDVSGVYKAAMKTTVCGPQTITACMFACTYLGAENGKILKYYNSYEAGGGTGPCSYCVGYMSAVFCRK